MVAALAGLAGWLHLVAVSGEQSQCRDQSQHSNCEQEASDEDASQHIPIMTDREDKVYKAKLAEQAERYDGE